MTFKELVENPERFRIGPNYRATNIVFPVAYHERILIVKRLRSFSSVIYTYYALRDPTGMRKLSSGEEALKEEARKLEALRELDNVPRLEYCNRRTLVRTYVQGNDFRSLKTQEERQQTLEEVVSLLEVIHKRKVNVGSFHVKNLILNEGRVSLIDFDGVFDESNANMAKAADLFNFVYSTSTTTRDLDLICLAINKVAEYGDERVKCLATDLIGKHLKVFRPRISKILIRL